MAELHAAEPALLAHWFFEEGSEDVLHDQSGNKYEGVIHGASWVRVGDSFVLQFGADKSFVDFGDVTALKPSCDFTFSAWAATLPEPLWTTDVSPEAVQACQGRVKRQNMKK